MVRVSAPGKLMLLGEHSVVYGHPCLVTTVDRRLVVTVDVASGTGLSIVAPQVKDTRFVEAAVRVAHRLWQTPEGGMVITTDSPFSNSYGFGSSSAVTVATLGAIAVHAGVTLTPREIFDAAYRVVLDVQGVGSGFDVAASAVGGTLYYVKGGTTLESVRFPQGKPEFVIGYTKVKANSVEIVREVAGKYAANREKMDRIFAAITKLVDDGRRALEKADWERFGTFMDFNQEYLRDIGVSTPKLEALISAAKGAGALGAKLSGAGGGDCMIALVTPESKQAVADAITAVDGEVVDIATGVPGVGPETTDDQSELFIVVDHQDNVLGYHPRHECHANKDLIHRTVGVLISDDNGRILLQKRSATKDTGPGMWGISCAGHVAHGQTYDDAVRRELREELGVDLPVTFEKKFIVTDDRETEMAALYRATSNGPFTPNPEEVEAVQFFDPRELQFKIAAREVPLTKCAYESLKQAGVLT